MMGESYSALGYRFEYLNRDCDYPQWSQYLLKRLKEAGAGLRGLDIGCGNGYFTRAMNKAGYRVDGMDISAAMLSTAKELAAEEGIRCEFLQGDIAKLKVASRMDFCTAINDCINYVPREKLETAFAHVYACLSKGGVFLFDISSEHKIKDIIGDNVFCEDGEDISYIWFNAPFEGGVKMELTFFVRGRDGRYSRFEETHIQYAYTEGEIIRTLGQVGFTDIVCRGHLDGGKEERINFCAFRR